MSAQPTLPELNFEFPEKLQMLFRPSRYKVARGGRGGAKSWNFARALLLKMCSSSIRVLCAREVQRSIKDSVHRLLQDMIVDMNLTPWFYITQTEIRGVLGGEFIFAGIKTDPGKIKSLEGVDICWVEEAAKVSKDSWEKLIPTIRKAGSEIWVSFNPDEESDPTYQMFITKAAELEGEAIIVEINWPDNPWFPETLRKEKDRLFRVDPESAEHVWNGKPRKNSAAQILKGKYVIEHFEPHPSWNGPYYGADWGFSNDPATLIKMWMYDNVLYIEEEAYEIGVELNDFDAFYKQVSGSKQHTIRADSSRPETISHVCNMGYTVTAAEKWPGCVEDGIAWLRGLERIVIHPRCKHTAEEALLYSYKVDKLTQDVLRDIVDKHNHCIDAIRYAMEVLIRMLTEGVVVHEEETHISEDMDEIESSLSW